MEGFDDYRTPMRIPDYRSTFGQAQSATMTDRLTKAANDAQCDKLTLIKEFVRLYNAVPSDTALTLTVVTSKTEHYTGS